MLFSEARKSWKACSKAVHLIQGEHSHFLEPREVECVLCMLGIRGEDKDKIQAHLKSLDSRPSVELLAEGLQILGLRSIDEIEARMSRMEVFQEAFRKVDKDQSGKICKHELIAMLQSLNADRTSAADLLAFLDKDGSGEVTWFEFVEGITSDDFNKKFPLVSLESLSLLPSVFQDHAVSAEEQRAAMAELPLVEKIMVWAFEKDQRRRAPVKVKEGADASADSGVQAAQRDPFRKSVENEMLRRESEQHAEKNHIRTSEAPTGRRPSSLTSSSMQRLHKVMSDMQVDDSKPHVLDDSKRRLVWVYIYSAVSAGAVAGLIAALLARVLEDLSKNIVPPEEDMILYYVLVSAGSLIWSAAEIVICCAAAIIFTTKIANLCGMRLTPMDHERAMIVGSLARAALELGHPQIRLFGVDPHKKANKLMLLMAGLAVLGLRGAIKFLAKLAVKKIFPRTALKLMPSETALLLVEIIVNVVFNYLTVRACMHEVMICCIGPSASVEITSKLIKDRTARVVELHEEAEHSSLPDKAKHQALRAAGVAIIHKKAMHPSNRYLLSHLAHLFADDAFICRVSAGLGQQPEEASDCLDLSEAMLNDAIPDERDEVPDIEARLFIADYGYTGDCAEGRAHLYGNRGSPPSPNPQKPEEERCCCCFKSNRTSAPSIIDRENDRLEPLQMDDEEAFFKCLSEEPEVDADFVLSVLILALIIDGHVGASDWKLLMQACERCDPPRCPHWPSFVSLTHHFVSGQEIPDSSFRDILHGRGAQPSCWFRSDLCLRSCLDKLNIF